MGIVRKLAVVALRQTVIGSRNDPAAGKDAESLTALLNDRFGRCGGRLSQALEGAADRSWRILELTLGGPAWWERGEAQLASPSDQPLRDALQTFFDTVQLIDSADTALAFRQECARQVRSARRAGVLDGWLDEPHLGKQVVATWFAAVDNAQLRDVERRLIDQIAHDLREAGYYSLARCLLLQVQSGSLLLASAVQFCFRRAVVADDVLRQQLPWAAAEPAEPPVPGLEIIAQALDRHGARLIEMIDLRGTGLDSRGDTLDLNYEIKQLGPGLDLVAEDVLRLVTEHQLDHRELRPTDLVALDDEEERRHIQQLLARYQAVSEDQRRRAPALHCAVGKLSALAGDLECAQRAMVTLAAAITDPVVQAELYASIYQIAVERRHWTEALSALKRAAAREPERFAPFPLAKFEPESILRCDAFGPTFLCKHRSSGDQVEVRALCPDLLDRRIAEVFHDEEMLKGVDHPAIGHALEGDFADTAQSRPYLVYEHFDGVSLADWLEKHGPIGLGEGVQLMRPLAEALRAAAQRGVLHRGLRPTAVLVNKDTAGWRGRILNFGLTLKPAIVRAALINPTARAATTIGQEAVRSLAFAAPEQVGRILDVPTGVQADLFSFGRLVCFALLGNPEADDEERENLPGGWRRVIGFCIPRNPARRAANWDPIIQRLSRAPTEAGPPKSDVALPRVQPASAAVSPAAAKAPDGEKTAPAKPASPPATATKPAAVAKPAPGPGGAGPAARPAAEEAAACVQRGVNLRMRGEFDQAIAEFTRAIQLDPASAQAHEGRGNAHVNKGEFDRAIADYTQALKLDPRLALVHVNRGLAYAKKKDSARAIADYTAAIKIDPKLALAYLNRGSAHARRGDYDKAVADYDMALALEPKLVLAWFNRGLAHAKRGNLERAIADYQMVLKLDPNNAPARARLREAQQKQASPGKASPASRPSRSGVAEGRQVRLLEGHADAVQSVVFTPDGRRAVSASEDKIIRLWDIKTAKVLTRYTGHTAGVTCVAVSPSGDLILSGSRDHTIRLWDLASGQEIRRFGGKMFASGTAHDKPVVSVAFSPDGLRAISAGWDKILRLWDVDSGKERKVYEGHQWLIHSVVFSPDGEQFLYGSEDSTARLCEIETGQEIRRFAGHSSWVLGVAFAADGKHVLTGSADGTVRLWQVASGKEIRQFGGGMGLVQCVSLSPDGKQALSGEFSPARQDSALFLWDVESGEQLARFSDHKKLIWCVAFSPDGKYAISGSADKTARVWRLPR